MKEKEKLRMRRRWKSRIVSILLAMLMVVTSVSWPEMEVQAGLVSNPAHTVVATYECDGNGLSADGKFLGNKIAVDNDTLATVSTIGATKVYKYIHKGERMNFKISHYSSCSKRAHGDILVTVAPIVSQYSSGLSYSKKIENGASLEEAWTADADYRLEFYINNGDSLYIYAQPVSVWFSSTSIPSTLSLAPNKTYQLSAAAGANRLELTNGYVSDSNCTGITWSSSNTAVATVDSTGKVTAVAPGTATITAKTNYGTNSKSCTVTVLAHKWSYSAEGNMVTAKCVENDSCEYHSGLTYTLSATSSTYNADSLYNTSLVTAVNNITSVTNASPTAVTYYTSYTDASTNTLTNEANSGASTEGGAPKNAGTYYAVASIGGAAAKAEFTIEKSARSCDLSMGEYEYGEFENSNEPSLTYTEQLSDTVNGTAKTADDIVTYSYKRTDAADATYTAWEKGTTGQSLSAGNYILKAEIAETDNYEGKTLTKEFTITPADIEAHVTAPQNKTVTYDGNAQAIDAVSVVGIDTAEVYYTDKENPTDADYTKDLSGVTKKDAGQYVISYKVVDTAGNYNSCYGSAALIINPIELEADVTLASAKTYDGKDDAGITAVDITDDSKAKMVEGEKISISLSAKYDSKDVGMGRTVTIYTGAPSITYENGSSTGNYKVRFKLKNQTDGMYVDTGMTTTADITAKTVELDWSESGNDGAFTYTGNSQGVTAKVTNLIVGDTAHLTYKTDEDNKICNAAADAGTYTAWVESIDNTNYVLPEESECKKTWSIAYLEITDENLPVGDLDWNKAVTIGKEGYEVSLENDSSWSSDSYAYNTEGTYDITYYVKQTSTGYITDRRTVQFKIDTTAPSGTITVEKEELKSTFKTFLNNISFGHFYKDEVQVTIDASDEENGSGVSKIEYQFVEKDASYDADGDWTAYTEPFTIAANSKKVVYARIFDKAGNQTIINSDGLVVYTDATPTDSVTFTKLSDKDLTTSVDTNGNTIASLSIKNNESDDAAVMVDTADYEIETVGEAEGKIVLKKDFLQGLEVGNYTLTVSYNPYGEEYNTDSTGQIPEISTINLTIEKAKASVTITSKDSKTYDGNAVAVPTFETTNSRGTDDANVTIEYKDKFDAESTYTEEAPKNCGSYLVRVTVKADDNYPEVSTEAEVTIAHKWSEWQTAVAATADRTGYKVRSCEGCNTTQYSMIPKIGDTDGTDDDSTDGGITGIVEAAIEITEEAIFEEAVLNNKTAELLAGDIFTEKEHTAVKNGAAAKIWVEISDTENLDSTDKQNMEAKAEEILGKSITELHYFDASLYYSVTQDDVTTTTSVSQPETNISISVKLPAFMVETDTSIARTYKLLRLHDGQIDVLDADYDEDCGMLTFETDRFSTYAVAYADTQLVTGITLSPISKTLTAKGETAKLTATVAPKNADNKNVTWSSDKTSVATVDENGTVTAVANGTAVITVTTEDGAKTATATITVDIPSKDDSDTDNNGNTGKDNTTDNTGKDNTSDTTGNTDNGDSTGDTTGNTDNGNSNKKDSSSSDNEADTDSSENDKTKNSETEAGTEKTDEKEATVVVKTEIKDKSQISKSIRQQLEAALAEVQKLDSKIQGDPFVVPKISDKKSDGTRVEFQIEIPADLQKDGRVFYLMSVDANGNIVILAGHVSEDGILTVEGNLDTDAVYQLIYEDIEDGDTLLSSFVDENGLLLDADGNAVTVDIAGQNAGFNWIPVMVTAIVFVVIFFVLLIWKRRKDEDDGKMDKKSS